jgi:putative colanic acid biosysnthesis UDP-glucose lipid carrier transferase
LSAKKEPVISDIESFKYSGLSYLERSDTKGIMEGENLLSSDVRFLIDLASSFFVLYLLIINKTSAFGDSYLVLSVLTSLLMVAIYRGRGIYNAYRTVSGAVWIITKYWCSVIIVLLVIGFFTKTSTIYSREIIISWFFLAGIVQIANNLVFRAYLSRSKNSVKQNALIVGAGKSAHYLAQHLTTNVFSNTKIVGVIESDKTLTKQWDHSNVPVLGNIKKIKNIIDQENIREVYIALPAEETALLEEIYHACMEKNVHVYFAPPIFDLTLINHNVKKIGGMSILSLSESPMLGSKAFTKKVIDYSLAATAIILLSPLLLTVAIAIKVTTNGPVIFKQKRHGWKGEVFNVYKFCSMAQHNNDHGIVQAKKGDPRITKLGKFIRSTSIDELPQLFNVLKGTMSLVGPRPHAVEHNEFYSDKINAYMARHYIKPGITGLAQISGCRGETKTIEQMNKRIDYDLEYINNWSNVLDFQIMLKTLFTLKSDQAY